jgi:hypothetical protein
MEPHEQNLSVLDDQSVNLQSRHNIHILLHLAAISNAIKYRQHPVFSS